MLAAFRLEKELVFRKSIFLCVRSIQIETSVAEFRLLFQTPLPSRGKRISGTAGRDSGNNQTALKKSNVLRMPCPFYQKLKSSFHFIPTLTEWTLPSARP